MKTLTIILSIALTLAVQCTLTDVCYSQQHVVGQITNSFGAGYVKMDGNVRSVPINYSWFVGTCADLEGYDQPPHYFIKWMNATTGTDIPGNPIRICPTTNTDYVAVYERLYDVTFRNNFPLQLDGTNGEIRVGDWNSRPSRTSPYTEHLVLNSTRVMEGVNQNYQAPGEHNYFRVFRDWSKGESSFGSSNPTQTDPVSSDVTYKANFNRQFNINVAEATYFEAGSGGTYKVNGTNVGSTWQGVFIESQSPSILLEAVPPSSAWSIRWSDGSDQNPRTIIPSDHFSLHAVYKLHLASSSPEAMAFNNQRKITRDNSGYWHKVYQSADLIWYTRSLNTSGTSWAPEKLVSPMFEGYPEYVLYRDPSIVYVPRVATGDGEKPDAQEHRIRIAYEIYATDESEHGIYVCELDLDGNITYGPEQLGSLWQGQGERARPVLGVTPDYVHPHHQPTAFFTLVAWYQSGMDELRCSMWLPDNSTSGITELGSGITEFSISPYATTSSTWHLAYIENNNVMYVPITADFWPQTGTPQTVLEGDESVYLNAPGISSVNASAFGDPIGISWQAFYWEFVTGVIQYSERNTQTWSYPATWVPYYTTASYVKPSVTGSIGTAKATIAWQTTETPLMHTVRGRPGSWGSVASMGGGVDPTLSAGYLANSFEYLVSRGTSAPYAIQRQGISTTDENEEGDSMPFTIEGRGGRLMFRNGSLHIAVLDAQANEMRLGFAEMNDTARINLSQFENVFATEPFAGTGMLKLTTLFTAKGQLPNGINIRMTLRDAATGNIVQNLRTFHVGDDTLVTFQTSLNHGNRQLKLVLQPVGVAQVSRIDLERWYVVDEAASLARQLAHATTPNGLPEVFAVHPNYPNPFNPTTTIKYDLPEASQVSLVVYDLLGRKVTELVSGQKAEGYHSAIWDASSVASGVYFARFMATDGSGNVRLNKVSKLVLTK